MKVQSAQVVTCCVFGSPPPKVCSTWMASFHTCLTVGPIGCSSPSTKCLHGLAKRLRCHGGGASTPTRMWVSPIIQSAPLCLHALCCSIVPLSFFSHHLDVVVLQKVINIDSEAFCNDKDVGNTFHSKMLSSKTFFLKWAIPGHFFLYYCRFKTVDWKNC